VPARRPKSQAHRDAEAELRGAIYWLLRVLEIHAVLCQKHREPLFVNVQGALNWLLEHGFAVKSPKARRLLARKRVPR